MCDAFPFGIGIGFETRLDVCTRENGNDPILQIKQVLVQFVDWRVCWVGADQRIGETVILIFVVVLVERNNEKAIVSLRPLVVGIEIPPKPGIAGWNALCRLTVMHIIVEVRNNKGDRRQRDVVIRKVCEPHIG